MFLFRLFFYGRQKYMPLQKGQSSLKVVLAQGCTMRWDVVKKPHNT